MAVYTLGIWTVKSGHEDEFVTLWSELASRTKADFPDATAMLLRDRERTNLFISNGPWPSLEDIERWRASETFQTSVGKLRAVLDGFEAHTMDVATAIE